MDGTLKENVNERSPNWHVRMVMGEQDGIDVGQVFQVHCWACLACTCDAWSEVNVVASMQEVRLSVG